jgi:hypothetical protein
MSPTDQSAIGATAAIALRRHYEKWRKLALTTAPANRARTRSAVDKLYQVVGLKPPQHIVWVGSPLTGCLAASFVSRVRTNRYQVVAKKFREQFSINLWSKLEKKASVHWWKDAESRLARLIHDGYFAATSDVKHAILVFLAHDNFINTGDFTLQDALHEASECLRVPLASQWSSIESSNHDDIINGALTRSWECGLGALDLDVPFIDFVRGAGVSIAESEGLVEMAESCGFYWTFDDVCVAVDRPSIFEIDAAGHLHSGKGAALHYRDGWKVYSWHGELVPRRFIQFTLNPTIEACLREPNMTIRTRMINMFGMESFMTAAGAACIQQDECGQLLRIEFSSRWDEPVVAVRVRNSTPEPDGTYKHYFIRVPPDTLTARQGVAWSFGLNPLDYRPRQET